MLVPASNGNDACRYIKSRNGLSGYESGGPYTLDHFRLTKGRTDLREFLWKHWHDHIKGVAEAKVGTVDRGTVRVLYLILESVVNLAVFVQKWPKIQHFS
jgi:hypothetical protein